MIETPPKIHIFFAVVLIFAPRLVNGQADSTTHRPDVLRIADGVAYTLTSPVRWNGKDLLMLGGMIASTSGLTFIDEGSRDFWRRQDNRFLDGIETVGYHYGKPYTAVTLTAGFYLSGVIFKNAWARETGMMLGTSVFSSSLIMGVLKSGAGRARPGVTAAHLDFKPFHQSPAYHAFPSGHSSVAFGLSLLLARRVEPIPLKVLFYSLAGTTAVSRMYSDEHWASDIAFGGMLAWFCADTAMSRLQRNRFKNLRPKDRVVWRVNPFPGGISLLGTVH